MYSFSYLEPVCCSMSSSNCCFLTCTQIFQEAGQVVWYSHLLKNFPQFIVIHTVKVYVNKSYNEIPPHTGQNGHNWSQQIINAVRGVEKRECSCTVGGNVNWYSHYGRQYGDSLNTRYKTTIWPSNPNPSHIPWGNQNWKRLIFPNVHCNTIYNCKNMEAT